MKEKAANAATEGFQPHQIRETSNLTNVRSTFEHLSSALSIWKDVWQAGGPEGFNVEMPSDQLPFDDWYAQSSHIQDDPFVRQLAEALAIAEAANDAQSAVCAEALRFAILARQVIRVDQNQSKQRSANFLGNRPYRPLPRWRLKRVLKYVDRNLDVRITLQHMASVAGLSRMHFAAQFRAATGLRPHDYLLMRRVDRAKDFLKKGDLRLAEIALSVGFQTQAHFTTVFKRFAGDTPHQWRNTRVAPTEESSLPEPTRDS